MVMILVFWEITITQFASIQTRLRQNRIDGSGK